MATAFLASELKQRHLLRYCRQVVLRGVLYCTVRASEVVLLALVVLLVVVVVLAVQRHITSHQSSPQHRAKMHKTATGIVSRRRNSIIQNALYGNELRWQQHHHLCSPSLALPLYKPQRQPNTTKEYCEPSISCTQNQKPLQLKSHDAISWGPSHGAHSMVPVQIHT